MTREGRRADALAGASIGGSSFLSTDCAPSANSCKQEQDPEKIPQSAVSYCHLRHFAIVLRLVIKQHLRILAYSTTKIHHFCLACRDWQNVG